MADPWSQFKPVVSTAPNDPWSRFVPVKDEALTWAQVPGKAIENAASSAGHFAKSIVEPFLSPVETITNLADVAAGGLRAGAKAVLPSAVFEAVDSLGNQDANKRIADKAGAVGQFMTDRYGSEDGLKRTLATDPVGAAADIATVLTGGGAIAARSPGMVGRAGQAMQTAASAIDPIANAARVVRGAGAAVPAFLGTTTGVGDRPIREAFRAGTTGNQAFTDNMRGLRPVGDVVDMADNAVGQMGRDRGAAYNANMAAVRSNQTPVNMAPIRQALDDAAQSTQFRGIQKDAVAAATVDEMVARYNDFLTLPPVERTAEALDALKQSIGEVRQRTQQGTLARRAADQAYQAIRAEITNQVPEYAAAMRDYANASDGIGEMRRTMSINDKASTDTTLRKLQSTMRNNVNTNYGQRERLLDTLAQYEPNLPAALAGQSLNTLAPRGLARISPMSIAAGGMQSMNPAVLGLLPATSPRLVGEASYAAGQVAGGAQRAANSVGLTAGRVGAAARGAYATDTPERAQRDQKKKTGLEKRAEAISLRFAELDDAGMSSLLQRVQARLQAEGSA